MILSTHLFCLLNLSTTPQLCPPLLLSYTFDVLDHIHHHKQPNTIRSLLCAIYYALCTMHYALFTMHYALCVIHYVYVFIRIHTYLLFYTYLYVFIRIHYFTWKSGEIQLFWYSREALVASSNFTYWSGTRRPLEWRRSEKN